MLFTDPSFLFVFLPIFLASYFCVVSLARPGTTFGVRNAARANWLIFVACVVFYAAWTGSLVLLLLFTVLLTHCLAVGIGRSRSFPTRTISNALAAAGIGLNVTVLIVFKYAFPELLASDQENMAFAVPQLLVPLGLAFVVCHGVSYIVDVHQGLADPYQRTVDDAAYMLFLPVAIAGPILRHRDVRSQFLLRPVGMAAFSYGVRRFVVGFSKTLLIAQVLAQGSAAIFSLPPDQVGIAQAWFGLACFSLQVYFDFSGYADMAIGLSRMLGFRILENFKWPYAATSVNEFWSRWNVSLTTWISTYAHSDFDNRLPAGRPFSAPKLIAFFLLVGLWHGPGGNVLWWGCFHGALLGLERIGFSTVLDRLPVWIRHVYVLLAVMVGWVIFRTNSMSSTLTFFASLLGLVPAADATFVPLTPLLGAAFLFAVVASVPLMQSGSRWMVTLDAMATSLLMLVGTAAVFAWRSVMRILAAIVRLFRH